MIHLANKELRDLLIGACGNAIVGSDYSLARILPILLHLQEDFF